MVDRSALGATDEPFEMVVERGKIREFARATMSTNLEYLDEPVPVAPPTFLTTTAFWSPAGQSVFSKLGVDLRRLLHGGQEYIFHGPPPHAGMVLTVRSRVADIYEKQGKRGGIMTFVVTITEFRDRDGNLVAESHSTAIETSKPPVTEEAV